MNTRHFSAILPLYILTIILFNSLGSNIVYVNFQTPISHLIKSLYANQKYPSNLNANNWGQIKAIIKIPKSINQQAYIKASNTDAEDRFGHSIAVSGDTVVVGTYLEASNATGVNGDQNDDSTLGAGAVYVFVRTESGWEQQAYLKASNAEGLDRFGFSVAISEDTIVVGAPFEASYASGVNGSQDDNSMAGAGAAYVFIRNGETWSQQAYLKASNPGADDWFGQSVAISGDTIIVGAYYEDSNATGVNGDQNSNLMLNAGAAYVFTRSGTTWSQQAYLKASNTNEDMFGTSVAISGDTIVVGAPYEDSKVTGVNGNQNDNSAESAGAAYVFVRSGNSWRQQAYLKASNTEARDYFGGSVDVYGNTIVVGAPFEDSQGSGVNGNQDSNSAVNAGAAYVYVRSGTTWSQQAYLKASNTGAGDYFGEVVSLDDNRILVGAEGEASSNTGINGDQKDNSASLAGAAYVFQRGGILWSQLSYLKASNTEANDRFGYYVALSGNTVIVGATGEASSDIGINGNQYSNAAPNSGAAFVFEIERTIYLPVILNNLSQ